MEAGQASEICTNGTAVRYRNTKEGVGAITFLHPSEPKEILLILILILTQGISFSISGIALFILPAALAARSPLPAAEKDASTCRQLVSTCRSTPLRTSSGSIFHPKRSMVAGRSASYSCWCSWACAQPFASFTPCALRPRKGTHWGASRLRAGAATRCDPPRTTQCHPR